MFRYSDVYIEMVQHASTSSSGLPDQIPTSALEFVLTVIKSTLVSLESRYRRFSTEAVRRRVASHISSDHQLFNGGVPEANERLRAACKHLFMANNICPLYLMVKETLESFDSEVGGSDINLNEMLELGKSLDTRLRFDSAKFVDTIFEASGLHEVLDSLKTAHGKAGPSALSGHEKGKVLKLAFSDFNATVEAWMSHQGEWSVTQKHTFLLQLKRSELQAKSLHPERYAKYQITFFLHRVWIGGSLVLLFFPHLFQLL